MMHLFAGCSSLVSKDFSPLDSGRHLVFCERLKPCLKMQNRAVLGDKNIKKEIKIRGFGYNLAVFASLFVLFYAVIRYLLQCKRYLITW
jgi:hypothetical protein